MDARNEFKVTFSPEGKGMKERIVPAISKVFSPSQFIHAQKKKSFYRALSGLSFHESSVKDKRNSAKVETDKSNPIYMSKSEGYTPKHKTRHEIDNSRLQSKNKDEKHLRRTFSEKSVVNGNNSRKSSHDSLLTTDGAKQRENLISQRTRQKSASLIYDNLASDSRLLRNSIGGYDNLKHSFGSYDNIKKPNKKDIQYLSKNSNERPKNLSHSINQMIEPSKNTSNDLNTKQECPVRPQRTRSISQSRKRGTTITPDVMAFQAKFENNENSNVSDHHSTILAETYEKKYFENLSELKDVDKDFRSRSRKKSEKNCEPEFTDGILLHSNMSSSKNNISHNKSNNERILSENGKRQGRYIKNKRSSSTHSTNITSLLDEMNFRVSIGSTENSNRIRAYSRQSSEEPDTRNSGERRSRFRSRSVITPNREQIQPLGQSNMYTNDQPVRPRRTRSTSRSKSSIVSNIFNIPNQFKLDVVSKSNVQKYEIEQANYQDSGLEDKDSYNHAKTRKKSENSRSSNDMHRSSKYLHDQNKMDYSQSEDEKDGGYYSLEKEENNADITKHPYQLPPTDKIPNPEYFQSDHSVDAIYISQVFMNLDKNNLNTQPNNKSRKDSFCDDYQTISHTLGEDIYDNCQRSSSENDDSTINADDNDNYQIIQTVEETEIYEVPFDSKTPNVNEDLYETVEFSNYEKVDNAYVNQSLTKGDDSDEGDYMDIKDLPAIKSETKVTVINIKDSDVEVTEKILPSSNMSIKAPTCARHDGYFNPYVGKKISQPNCGEIYDNITKTKSHVSNSKCSGDFNSMSHSYPVTKAMIPKLPERNRFRSRSEPVNASIGQNITSITNQNNSVSRFNSHKESNKKTSLDNKKTNQFEFISETNYKVDNLDYTFKLNFSQLPKGSSHMEFIPKETSHSEFIPNGSNQTEFIRKTSFRTKTSRVSLSPNQVHTFGDLLQPLTFQDLLKDKHLNPPENEAVLDTHFCDTLRTSSLLYPESQAQKQLDSFYQNTLNTKRKLQNELSNQSFNDNISVCWSEADSEFEFMNVTK